MLVSVVAGALTEGREGWEFDNWPIDPFVMAEGGRGDGAMARELVDHFGLGQVDWCHVLYRTKRLVRRQDFRRLVVRIAEELGRVEVLDADDLRSLMEPEAVVA